MCDLSTGFLSGKALILSNDTEGFECYIAEIKEKSGFKVDVVYDWGALKEFYAEHHYDLIVMGLGCLSKEVELKQIHDLVCIRSEGIRFAIYPYMNASNRVAFSEVCHRLFPVDGDPQAMISAIEESQRALDVIGRDRIYQIIQEIKVLPSIPDTYMRLNQELLSENSTAGSIAAIIEQDMAMSAKILQLVNSACFTMHRVISNLKEAVTILGMREVRDLVLTSKVFDQYPQDGSWSCFAFDHIRDRSVLVAGLSREICRSVKAPQEVMDQSFLAALLQDFGMLILATHDAEGYRKIIYEASRLGQPLYAVEKMRLGVTHTEVGAYMLSRWNIAPGVIETVLFHHFPSSSKFDDFSALTAVHVADAILPNVTNQLNCQISSRLSHAYLERLGLLDKLEEWQYLADRFRGFHPGCGGKKSHFS